MVQISVVIITYNEAHNIGRCLDSIRAVADDIVVVDSFSTDRTAAICAEKGVRFISHIFEGHIEQKNYAITQAHYPHILSIDADEALSEILLKSIVEVKANWSHEAYWMNRMTNYCGQWIKHCGWYPDQKLRLWDSRKGQWTGTNPHDKFELNHGSEGMLKGDLLHYSYYSIHDHLKQVNYFTDISSKALHNQGVKTTILQIIIAPLVKFIRDYFIKLGFLDGLYGFAISIISSHATFLKYLKLRSYSREGHP
jgi:glycosyltransferase involved in cell wall biosynthesis